MRKHHCPHCQKHWRCLAENQNPRHYRTVGRPSVPCILPIPFTCPQCAQEGKK